MVTISTIKPSQDAKMNIAYLVLAHTDPGQLERLLHAIDYRCKIYIHLDKKTNDDPFTAIHWPGNATFIKDRVNIYWGGFSMVRATINLMRAALSDVGPFSHLVFLSGLDYPIRPVKKFYEMLISNPGKQFIRFINIKDSPEYYSKVASHFYFRDRWFPGDWLPRKVLTKVSEHQSLILKKPLKNVKHAFGFANWAITSKCAAYILEFIEKHPAFVKYYSTHDCPDEFFFHTIIANSPFFKETEGFFPYQGRGTWKYSFLHTFRSTKYDKVYELGDFDEIKNSGKYFARKLTTERSLPLIDKINIELLNMGTPNQIVVPH